MWPGDPDSTRPDQARPSIACLLAAPLFLLAWKPASQHLCASCDVSGVRISHKHRLRDDKRANGQQAACTGKGKGQRRGH